jgi:CheY-like chemotaxis protein
MGGSDRRILMSKPHVLVVDDDVFVVETLRTYLELQGCRVSAAYGMASALEKLRATDKIDLVILDYIMPDGSGTEVLQFMGDEKTMQRPPVIMSSGVLDQDAPIWEELRRRLPETSQSLIQAYVSKPYTLDAMDIAIHEVLGGDYIPEPRKKSARKVS